MSEVQLLRVRATFHTLDLPQFYLPAYIRNNYAAVKIRLETHVHKNAFTHFWYNFF